LFCDINNKTITLNHLATPILSCKLTGLYSKPQILGGFLKLFSSKSTPIVGIDIGTSAIKIAQLSGSLSDARLTSWGVNELPSGSLTDGLISNEAAVAEALERALSQSGAKAKKAAISIPASHAITKIISMPNDLSESALEDQIQIEAVHIVPYSADEVNIDFQVMGPSAVDPTTENDVLFAACRSDVVEAYQNIVEDCGLELVYADIDTFALERLYRFVNPFPHSKKSEITAFFDIGVSTTKLIVFNEEKVLYTRQQNFGAKQLVQQIRREYGVNNQDAETLIVSESPPDDYYSAVLVPYFKSAGQELSRALQFFFSSSSFSKIDNVVLTGGVSGLPVRFGAKRIPLGD